MKTINYTLHNFQDKDLNKPRVYSCNCKYTDEDIFLLYFTYLKYLDNLSPGKFDGATLIDREDGSPKFIRVVCGNDGSGSIKAFVKDILI